MSCVAAATNTVWKAGHSVKCGLRSNDLSIFLTQGELLPPSRLRVVRGRSGLDGLGSHDRCFNHICTEPYVIDEVGMNCICKYTFSLSAGLFMVLCIHFAAYTFCMAVSMFAKK